MAVRTVKKENVPVLGGLSHGIDHMAVVHDGYQTRRRRKVAIPQIVPHILEMPDTLPCFGIERE